MLTRRRFLSFLGAGIATAATAAIVEPVNRLYMLREQRTREELAAMYPEPTGTLFGIDASSYPEWKAARYTQTDAARLFRELTLSYANPEQASRFATRS